MGLGSRVQEGERCLNAELRSISTTSSRTTLVQDCGRCSGGLVDEHDEDEDKPRGSMALCRDCFGTGKIVVCPQCGAFQ